MREETRIINKIENLIGFPYKNFSEFVKSWKTGNIQMGVDFGLAREWAMSGGVYALNFLKTLLHLINVCMFCSAIGFIIYIILINSYLWLLALPLLIIGFFLAHPIFSRNTGCLSPCYFLFAGIGFIWSFSTNSYGLLGVTTCILFIWFCMKTIYTLSFRALLDAISIHEDLLCSMWNAGQLRIQSENGGDYSLPLEERLKYLQQSIKE